MKWWFGRSMQRCFHGEERVWAGNIVYFLNLNLWMFCNHMIDSFCSFLFSVKMRNLERFSFLWFGEKKSKINFFATLQWKFPCCKKIEFILYLVFYPSWSLIKPKHKKVDFWLWQFTNNETRKIRESFFVEKGEIIFFDKDHQKVKNFPHSEESKSKISLKKIWRWKFEKFSKKQKKKFLKIIWC